MKVELTLFEQSLALHVAHLRHLRALRAKRLDAYGCSSDIAGGLAKHAEGALGEMAVAKALGIYWNGSVDTFKRGGDVGRLQVRTRSKPAYELLVRPDDPDDSKFVLVRGSNGTYNVVGWLDGKDAKRAEWLKRHGDRDPAYFVPDDALRSMSEL